MASTDVGYYAAKVIFSRLNINVTYDYWTDDARAIQKIVDGEADAYFGSTGKVFGLLRAVKNEDRRLHLVPIPYDRRLQDLYLPTSRLGRAAREGRLAEYLRSSGYWCRNQSAAGCTVAYPRGRLEGKARTAAAMKAGRALWLAN